MDLKMIYPVIVALVPLLIAGIKAIKEPPPWLLPILAPVLGALADLTAAWALNTPTNPALGAILGMAGVGLREVVDQIKKATASEAAKKP